MLIRKALEIIAKSTTTEINAHFNTMNRGARNGTTYGCDIGRRRREMGYIRYIIGNRAIASYSMIS